MITSSLSLPSGAIKKVSEKKTSIGYFLLKDTQRCTGLHVQAGVFLDIVSVKQISYDFAYFL